MSTSNKVKFFFPCKSTLTERTRLKHFIEKIFHLEKKSLGELNYVFCTDKYLLKINREYLGHNSYTDIITFDLSESSSIWAEVYISIDRVRENAKALRVSFKSELHRVVFHGVLHLCGYKDKTKIEKVEIREAEDYYLAKYLS